MIEPQPMTGAEPVVVGFREFSSLKYFQPVQRYLEAITANPTRTSLTESIS